VITFLIVVFTYRLNTGPFNFTPYQAVVIIFASHGSFIWFPVTALAGSFLLLFLGKLTPPRKIILRLGQNTLLLMCLNGIFYHYINGPTAKWVLDTFPGNGLTVFLSAIIVTVASLMLCIPLIYVFNRFVPQLVGKPKLNGPWLNNFI
jgi:acyltransferase